MYEHGLCLTEIPKITIFMPVYVLVGHAYLEGVVFNFEAGRQLNKMEQHVTVLVTIEGVTQEKVARLSDVFFCATPVTLNYGAYIAMKS